MLGRDYCLGASNGDLGADRIGIITPIGKQRVDAIGDHPEQGAKALDVVCLSGRQDEAERPTLGVTSGVELGGEAAARPAKRLGLLSPLFMPTAQWCARTTVLSIMSAARSRPAISAKVSNMASNTPVSTQRR